MRKYDVALSFAGEDRQDAEALANLLKSGGHSVFYDKYERAQLWGKDLYVHLSSVYKDKAHYCVMFLSEHYVRKLWPTHERQNAQARAFQESQEYILPVRIDDTEIPGILPTVGYLDLRSMTIEEIYQALVEKLSGLTSLTTTNDIATSAGVESDPGEFVLLCPKDGRLYFVPFQDARWDSTEISLELLPESPEEAAFLRSLRNNRRDRLAFALQEDAAWVSPQEVAQTMSGSQTVWKVVLREDSRGYDFSLDENATFGTISPDEVAEMRARRILLDEELVIPSDFPNQTGQAGLLYKMQLELLVKGQTKLQVNESPIPHLYQSFGQTVERFRKFARLASALYLKLSNTAEDILQLDLELLNQRQLQVRFKGRRPRPAVNVEPSILEVNGICPLSG
jgi:hypothetical protein